MQGVGSGNDHPLLSVAYYQPNEAGMAPSGKSTHAGHFILIKEVIKLIPSTLASSLKIRKTSLMVL